MYLRASYTVEGSVVISICMIIVGICIILGFNIYKETIGYVQNLNIAELDSVTLFNQITNGKILLESFI